MQEKKIKEVYAGDVHALGRSSSVIYAGSTHMHVDAHLLACMRERKFG
jgi:hypothetical protein